MPYHLSLANNVTKLKTHSQVEIKMGYVIWPMTVLESQRPKLAEAVL